MKREDLAIVRRQLRKHHKKGDVRELTLLVELGEHLVQDPHSSEEQLNEGVTLLRRARIIAERLHRVPEWCAACKLAAVGLRRMQRGNRQKQYDEAIVLITGLHRYLSFETTPEVWAMELTNEAMLRLERPGEIDPLQVDKAFRLLKDALRVRSEEKDPSDWAYTQANLALALRKKTPATFAEAGQNLSAAIEAYRSSLRGFRAADNQEQRILCLNELAETLMRMVRHRKHELLLRTLSSAGSSPQGLRKASLVECGRSRRFTTYGS